MFRFHLARLFLISVFMASSVRCWGISINGFATLENDRFSNDGSFVGDAFDFSGVGRSSDSRWGTLVSSNVFISAQHLHPAVGQSLTFYATNDSSGASVTRTVVSGQRIGSSDLWVGVLGEPVSSNIKAYSFATTAVSDFASFQLSPYYLENSYMVGRSPTAFTSLIDVAVGRNRLDFYAEDVAVGSTTDDAIVAIYDTVPLEVDHEAILQGGDSGAPLLVDVGGNLELVGINWFVGELVGGEDISGFSYLGNYHAAIEAIIDVNVVSVPEMETMAGLLGLCSLLVVMRRRQSIRV